MDLSHHKNLFMKEHVDGEILSECDDDVLHFELGVTNKSQRTKLMNIINGVASVRDYNYT